MIDTAIVQIVLPAFVTVVGAAIILGKQLQIIKILTERVNLLESSLTKLTQEVTRLTTLLEEREKRNG